MSNTSFRSIQAKREKGGLALCVASIYLASVSDKEIHDNLRNQKFFGWLPDNAAQRVDAAFMLLCFSIRRLFPVCVCTIG